MSCSKIIYNKYNYYINIFNFPFIFSSSYEVNCLDCFIESETGWEDRERCITSYFIIIILLLLLQHRGLSVAEVVIYGEDASS